MVVNFSFNWDFVHRSSFLLEPSCHLNESRRKVHPDHMVKHPAHLVGASPLRAAQVHRLQFKASILFLFQQTALDCHLLADHRDGHGKFRHRNPEERNLISPMEFAVEVHSFILFVGVLRLRATTSLSIQDIYTLKFFLIRRVLFLKIFRNR